MVSGFLSQIAVCHTYVALAACPTLYQATHVLLLLSAAVLGLHDLVVLMQAKSRSVPVSVAM